jgi:hypothetical protein
MSCSKDLKERTQAARPEGKPTVAGPVRQAPLIRKSNAKVRHLDR